MMQTMTAYVMPTRSPVVPIQEPATTTATPTTDTDNTLCTYTDGICDTCVDGLIVDNDTDNDGVCDADEVSGCQDESACNYNAAATDSDGNCTFVDGVCETCVEGLIVDNDADNDGVCDAGEVTGCTDPAACNYDSNPTTDTDNALCTFVPMASATPA